MPRTLDQRIEAIDGEPGEWFVYLKPGWAINDANTDSAQHCFGEDTKAEIRRTMKRAVKCNCIDCFVTVVGDDLMRAETPEDRIATGYQMLRQQRTR